MDAGEPAKEDRWGARLNEDDCRKGVERVEEAERAESLNVWGNVAMKR
jgi:hypothetical protein